MKDFEFTGCTATMCIRKIKGRRIRVNYLIEETCFWAQKDKCLYRRSVEDYRKGGT